MPEPRGLSDSEIEKILTALEVVGEFLNVNPVARQAAIDKARQRLREKP